MKITTLSFIATSLITPNLSVAADMEVSSLHADCSMEMDRLRLTVEDCEEMDATEKDILWRTLIAERSRLGNFLGEEVFGQPQDIPISVKVDTTGHNNGRVYWHIVPDSKSNADFSCGTIQKGELVLESLDPSLVGHELFHLLVQPPCVTSQAAYEGHAYAITSMLYPDEEEPADMQVRLDHKGYRSLWRQGWDFNNLTLSVRPPVESPIPNKGFETLLHYEWARLWEAWEEQNPGFLKNFYTEVGVIKRRGIVQIDKDEIIALADSITPGFSDWMKKKARPLMDLGSDGSHQKRKAIDLGTQTDIVQYRMKRVENPLFQEPYWVILPYATGLVVGWTASSLLEDEQELRPGQITYINPNEPGRFFMVIPREGDDEVVSWSIDGETLRYWKP